MGAFFICKFKKIKSTKTLQNFEKNKCYKYMTIKFKGKTLNFKKLNVCNL